LEEERKRLAKENALLKEEINQLRLAARAQSLGPNPATPTLGRLTGIQHPDPLTGAGILQLTTSISEYFDRKREMLENPKPQVNQEVMARLERLETRLEALTQPKVDPRDEQIKELQTRITELKESLQRKEVEELKSKILALEKRVEESKSRPQHAYREDLYALGDKLLTSLEKRRPAEALVAALAPYSPYYRGKPSKVEEPEASKHDTLMNFLSRNAPELIG
jgi:DNA repair exonuclease SbcCD ATPase subunit